jgi:hypothetical protein
MVPEAQRLHAAFVAAFPAYATATYSVRGYPLDRDSVESIEWATAVLGAELGSELELPFREQRRSPLEIVRQALAILASALANDGVAPNATTGVLIDDDPYGLMPGSSSDLGQEAHEAHLLWGVTKAAVVAGVDAVIPPKPTVVVMAATRRDRDDLLALVESRGLRCSAVRNPGAVASAIEDEAVVFALVDLDHRSARDAIAQLTNAGVSVVVYGESIDDLVETGLRAQGVRDVVDRLRFLADPAAFIPVIA